MIPTKTQFIGMGTVGTAQAHLLREVLNCTVNTYDPYKFNHKNNKIQTDIDITFICTCENNVEEALTTLIQNKVKGLYVIKSSTLPGTTQALSKKYNIHICHNPEFLREKTAILDALHPDRVIIGECCKKHGQTLQKLYQPLNCPIYRTTSTESELAKLVANTYLATLITFWNQIHQLTSKLNIDTKDLAQLVCADKRISKYGTEKFGEKYNGRCLPKDVNNLMTTYSKNGLNPHFIAELNYCNALETTLLNVL